MEFVDTHCHLDFEDFDDDRSAVLDRARAAGLVAMLTIGIDEPTSRAAVALAREHDDVHASVGVHPNHVGQESDAVLDRIADLARDPAVVAVGETGLDFFRDRAPRERQDAFFRIHLEIAADVGKPVVVHSRESGETTMDVIEEVAARIPVRGVFHCFTSTEEVLRRALAVGLKIGVSGIVTFPKGDNVRDIVRATPDDHLLLDTDAPFLAPVPHRGKRNEPAFAVDIARTIADIRGVSLEDAARITTRNARELFGFDGEEERGKIAYVIRNTLYLALTNDCLNDCPFCARNRAYRVKGHDIRLDHDPSAAEVIAAMGDTSGYDEVCFCGFGEPTMRLETLRDVADELKRRGAATRLNTNGLGSRFHERDITDDLVGRIDTVSVSLNTGDPEQYVELCRPRYDRAWESVCEFVRAAVGRIPRVVCTVVEMPGVDVERSRRVTEKLGAEFRVRSFVDVG